MPTGASETGPDRRNRIPLGPGALSGSGVGFLVVNDGIGTNVG